MSDGEWDQADDRRAEDDLMHLCCQRRGCDMERCYCPSDASGVRCSARRFGKPGAEQNPRGYRMTRQSRDADDKRAAEDIYRNTLARVFKSDPTP